MSAPGQTEDFLIRCFARYSFGIETLVWNEDIDLSGGAGAITPMVGSLYDSLYVGDAIKTRKGFGTPQLLGIMGADESGGGTGGYIAIQGRARKIRFGKLSVVAAGEYWLMDLLDHPVALPAGNKLDVVGNASGAGAEQHAVILVIGYPELGRPPMMDPLSYEGPIGLKTGTRTASTFGPLSSDVLGDYLAFEDSETGFSTDASMNYVISEIINGPGLADTSVVGIRYPKTKQSDELEICIPASMGGSETMWKWPPIKCNGSSPALLGACGASTTSDEYGLQIGLNVPYGDFDAEGQRGTASGTKSAQTPRPSQVAPFANQLKPIVSAGGSPGTTRTTRSFRR